MAVKSRAVYAKRESNCFLTLRAERTFFVELLRASVVLFDADVVMYLKRSFALDAAAWTLFRRLFARAESWVV